MPEYAVAAVMIHVGNVPEALAWYQRAFPDAVRQRLPDSDFEYLCLGNVNLELVPSDVKVPSGPAGSVVYWQVRNFEASLQHFQAIGARLYRGPMLIENGQAICQVQDPWGNCIGLRGPSTESRQS
ncbi:glyoxalase/bleomycin resistance/dioxygenase family protein [Chitinimonas taiwanensis]|uniref:glyoxalase/bleomycin resistance/dioxygenase family protein n=1 Tax=Chitinimonas taiwanensis TaxID=240412 RepID=UPI0009307007|nr:glyoxalase/bleomycin resistance/dioxygenase family protein [Chitinimonas taiwanensis]